MHATRQFGGAARILAAVAIVTAMPASAPADDFVLRFTADMMSDGIDRGMTHTEHRPGFTGTIDLQKDWFYLAAEISNLKAPTAPAAEIAFGGGIRPVIPGYEDTFEIDIGVLRYAYPRATPVDASGSGAWTEAEASVIYHPTKYLSLGAEVAYSPDYNNSGARSVHTAGHVKFDFSPPNWLPIQSYYLWGKLGRMQFTNVSSGLGAYHLPNYTHWLLGGGLRKDPFTFEVNYTNTTLSRENCYILTGDPGASGGGAVSDPNPLGLRSNWCGPAVYAKLTFEFSTEKKK
jgi:uncharacterized protein (TIGR02001 family)